MPACFGAACQMETGRVSDGLGSQGARSLGTMVACIGYLSCQELIHLPHGLTAEFQRFACKRKRTKVEGEKVGGGKI